MTDYATNRSKKSKIGIRNYGEAIDKEILRLQEILSSIDATPAESVISRTKEGTDNKNIKKKTLLSEKSSNPTHTENVIAPEEDDILKPQYKISKIIEYKEDIEIILVNKQDIIEIIDSDEEDERHETINIKTEIFEAEENKLQIDEDSTNATDNEENAMISINFDNVSNEETQNMDNFEIAKLTCNNDTKVQQEILDEYEKKLHINIKQEPEECNQELDSEDIEVMKEVNRYDFFLSKVFQASKFANASSLLDDNIGVTNSTETANSDASYASLDNIGVTDRAGTANGDSSYASLHNIGVTNSTETANGDASYASLDNIGVTNSTETANSDASYASLDNIGVTDSAEIANGVASYASLDNIGVTDRAGTANGDSSYASLHNIGVTDRVETDNGDASYASLYNIGITDSTETANGDASLDNEGVTDSAETDNVVPTYASLNGDMLQTVIKMPPKSSAERQKKYREKLKNENPQKYEIMRVKHLEKVKENNKKKRARQREKEKQEQLRKWRKANAERDIIFKARQESGKNIKKMNQYKLHMREHALLPDYTVC